MKYTSIGLKKISVSAILALPLLVSAQGFGVTNPIKADNFNALLELIINVVIQIGVPLVILAVIFTGFLFVFAQGDKAKLTKAKDALLTTVIGAAIVLGAYAISAIIQSTVNSLK